MPGTWRASENIKAIWVLSMSRREKQMCKHQSKKVSLTLAQIPSLESRNASVANLTKG